MYAAFVKLLNMSAAASILIAVVIALRFLLRKTPKKYICILWAIVALRLICPISVSSAVSAFNYIGRTPQSSGQVEYIHYNGKSEKPKAEVTITLPAESEKNDGPTVNFETKGFYIPTLLGIWGIGFGAMLFYAAFSYAKVRTQVRHSIPLDRRNYRRAIYICDSIPTPFILGVLKPKIYLPSTLDEDQQRSVIAHERAHIARLDHLWKPLGFLLLSIHWFNPLVWAAYALLCRDIEMACDEKVIERMTPAEKQAYSTVLLTCSMPRKTITACPLAFGESGVKERVKGILNYRKPTFWVISISIILCIAIAVGFLSNPLRTEDYIRFRRAETKPFQPHSYQFKMQMGETVRGAVVHAEQWQNGKQTQGKYCSIPKGEKNLAVSVTETKDGSEYQVEIDTNPYTSALDATFSLPAGARLMDVYSWHGAKDIPLTPDKQVLLAAYIFGKDGFVVFDFDNEDFEEAGDRLRNQECAILVYAEFDAMHPINALHAGYWDSLRQNGLLRQENGEEIFYFTLPAKYAGELPQEEYDAGNGFWYQSARKQEDGSVTYGLNLAQYNEDLYMLEEMMESVCRHLSNDLSGEITAVVHNPAFTEFTVTVASKSVDSLDYERVYQLVNFDARLYSLYVTGDIRREITIRYQDTHGNPVEPVQPNYWLTIGTDGVSAIDVDLGNSVVYSYYEPSLVYYFVGESRKLSRLDGMGSLKDVSIIAKNDADQVIWQHSFTGDEEFPWEENGWRLSQNASSDYEQKRLEEVLTKLQNLELGNLLEFVNPVRVEFRDNTLIDKASPGKQMTLEELLTSDHWMEQPIPEGVTGPGTIRRGLILHGEKGNFLVISYDTNALSIFNSNGNCIGRYTGSYTGEQMVDMLWDWMLTRIHSGTGYMADMTLTQMEPQGMLSVLMRPTTALNIDGMGAVTPENQEEWISAWNTVLNGAADGTNKADASTYYGIFLSYQDAELEVHRDSTGFFLRKLGADDTYSAQASRPLIQLLEPVLKEFNYTPVKPSELKGIQSASLVLDGMQYSIFQGDPKLSQLEAILTSGKPMLGMSKCWFTSLLNVTLPSGETKTVSVATDSCGAYLSNGVCYEFPGDNERLYSLFGIDLAALTDASAPISESETSQVPRIESMQIDEIFPMPDGYRLEMEQFDLKIYHGDTQVGGILRSQLTGTRLTEENILAFLNEAMPKTPDYVFSILAIDGRISLDWLTVSLADNKELHTYHTFFERAREGYDLWLDLEFVSAEQRNAFLEMWGIPKPDAVAN